VLKIAVGEYLSKRVGPDAVLERAERFGRGSSRLTWFVDYREAPGAPVQKVILRGDHPGGGTIPTSLEQEYFMYERLGRSDVPVARVRWWEDNPAWVDKPFYVRDRVDGSWEIPHFSDPDPRHDALRVEIGREHMRKLAVVHRVDWRALGFDQRLPAPENEAAAAHLFVDQLIEQLAGFAMEPMPLVTEAVAWLHAHAPAAPCLCLCKGTNGLGEEVFRGTEIVAMSDWEEASIGDPAADFAMMQDFARDVVIDGEQVWGMEQAIAYYREVSGIEVTLDSVRYYQIVRALSTVVLGHKAAVITHRGQADIRQIWTGSEVLHLGRRMLASGIGLGAPIESGWFAEMNETVV
jgi:aminoglycoside phosphotransferase (APT) family kinase protein